MYIFRPCMAPPSTLTRSFDSREVTICSLSCKSNVADVEFLPCHHRVVCSMCLDSAPFKRCPLCYCEIDKVKLPDGEVSDFGEFLNDKFPSTSIELKTRISELEKLRQKLEQLEMELTCLTCMDSRCQVRFF